MADVDVERFTSAKDLLRAQHVRWLVTGSAGFIGSHLLERLLTLEQEVVSLDNFATGSHAKLETVRAGVGEASWRRHRFIEGDIADIEVCRTACASVNIVLHQAALGSVPRSIKSPLDTHAANVNGFVNMLAAAKAARISRFVYASSSAVYGDDPTLPKTEERIGRPLSPYALSKRVNEEYADVFSRCYDITVVGLRYFNVFGPRQDPSGPYAAVIPRWAAELFAGEPVAIHGDGSNSRDFCYVDNVVQANLLAALTDLPGAQHRVYNVALGRRTTLVELFHAMRSIVMAMRSDVPSGEPVFWPVRAGDIPHSHADIRLAREELGYRPTHDLEDGLREALGWYDCSAAGLVGNKEQRSNGATSLERNP